MKRPAIALGQSSHNGAYLFRIYIAGGAPNSVRALANLYAICRKHFPASHRIEVIDILQEPMRALAEAILVTPTVVKLSPAPEVQIHVCAMPGRSSSRKPLADARTDTVSPSPASSSTRAARMPCGC